MGKFRNRFMVSGIVHARYDFPSIRTHEPARDWQQRDRADDRDDRHQLALDENVPKAIHSCLVFMCRASGRLNQMRLNCHFDRTPLFGRTKAISVPAGGEAAGSILLWWRRSGAPPVHPRGPPAI